MRKPFYRLRLCRMFPQMLLHPDKIVPVSELIAALMKSPRHPITHTLMKPDTVISQIFILRLRTGDTGIYIENILPDQSLFQRFI